MDIATLGQLNALFVVDDHWEAVPVLRAEAHPGEDVTVLQLAATGLNSIMNISGQEHFGSLRYRGWGYPEDTYRELVDGWEAQLRPDLVYAEGYVRRRLTGVPLPLRGTAFYQLSEVMELGHQAARS